MCIDSKGDFKPYGYNILEAEIEITHNSSQHKLKDINIAIFPTE